MTIDIFNLPAHVTSRVGVAFDDAGEPTSGFVIVSRESEQYRNEIKRQRVAGIRRSAVKKGAIDTKTEAGAAALADLVEQQELDVACAVVVDWFGFTNGKKPAEFDPSVVRQALQNRPSWKAAIVAALDDEQRFLPAQPTS